SGRPELVDPCGPVATPGAGRLPGGGSGAAADGDGPGEPASQGVQQGQVVAGTGPVGSATGQGAAQSGEPVVHGERARLIAFAERAPRKRRPEAPCGLTPSASPDPRKEQSPRGAG